jgi:hypothetical protein
VTGWPTSKLHTVTFVSQLTNTVTRKIQECIVRGARAAIAAQSSNLPRSP